MQPNRYAHRTHLLLLIVAFAAPLAAYGQEQDAGDLIRIDTSVPARDSIPTAPSRLHFPWRRAERKQPAPAAELPAPAPSAVKAQPPKPAPAMEFPSPAPAFTTRDASISGDSQSLDTTKPTLMLPFINKMAVPQKRIPVLPSASPQRILAAPHTVPSVKDTPAPIDNDDTAAAAASSMSPRSPSDIRQQGASGAFNSGAPEVRSSSNNNAVPTVAPANQHSAASTATPADLNDPALPSASTMPMVAPQIDTAPSDSSDLHDILVPTVESNVPRTLPPDVRRRPPLPIPPAISLPGPLGTGKAKPTLAWRAKAFRLASADSKSALIKSSRQFNAGFADTIDALLKACRQQGLDVNSQYQNSGQLIGRMSDGSLERINFLFSADQIDKSTTEVRGGLEPDSSAVQKKMFDDIFERTNQILKQKELL